MGNMLRGNRSVLPMTRDDAALAVVTLELHCSHALNGDPGKHSREVATMPLGRETRLSLVVEPADGTIPGRMQVVGNPSRKSSSVSREIGIRMALGAGSGDTLRLVVREGAAITAIGAAAGLALSFLLGQVLAGMLYQVSGSDPVVFLVSPAVLGAVSLVACYVPARRASRVDPMVALRYE